MITSASLPPLDFCSALAGGGAVRNLPHAVLQSCQGVMASPGFGPGLFLRGFDWTVDACRGVFSVFRRAG